MSISDRAVIVSRLHKLRAEAGAIYAACEAERAIMLGAATQQIRDFIAEKIQDLTMDDSQPDYNHKPTAAEIVGKHFLSR